MPYFIPKDILSPLIGEGYVSQAQRERRFELAAWENRNNNDDDKPRTHDLAFIFGLSWRLHSITSDVDLVGGFDARRMLALGGMLERLGVFLARGRAALRSWVVDGGGRMSEMLKNTWRNTTSMPSSPPGTVSDDEMVEDTKRRTSIQHPSRGQEMQETQIIEEKGKKGEKKSKKKKRTYSTLPSLHDALHDVLPSHSRIPPSSSSSNRHNRSYHDREEKRKRRHDFAAILAQVDRDAIAALCLQVFQERRGSANGLTPPPEVDDPILGAAHVLWPVRFHARSGNTPATHWIVKVPVAGTPDTWDELGADALRGEALTLRMLGTLGLGDNYDDDDDDGDGDGNGNSSNEKLKPRTRRRRRFPAPLPIQADPGAHNAIHAPYLIMEFVEGVRLDEYWFAGVGDAKGTTTNYSQKQSGMETVNTYSAEHIRLRRRRVLESLARAMLRLSATGAMRQGGAPVVDEAAHWRLLTQIAAPARHLDVQAMLGRWFAHGGDNRVGSGDEGGDHDEDDGNSRDENDNEGDRAEIERTPLYTAIWPHDEPREAYTALLDQYPPETEAAAGVDALLRLLIKMIREPPSTSTASSSSPSSSSNQHDDKKDNGDRKDPFVLTHPDLQLRHVIVCEQTGEVRGIVGWDGVRAVPRSLGNEAFPRWLVRDFNPFTYRWTPEVMASSVGGRIVVSGAQQQQQEATMLVDPEDPPWVLAELRSMYADIVKGLKRKGQKTAATAGKAVGVKAKGKDNVEIGVDIARQSLLALTVDVAVEDPRCRSAVLRRLLEKCSRQFEELDYGYIVNVLGSGDKLDWYTMKCLRRNARELVEKGYVRGAVVW